MTITRFRSGFLVTIIFLWVLGSLCGCAISQRKKIVKADRIYSESSSAARAAFALERVDEAASFYTLALKRARAMDQSEDIGNAAYNLAACMLRLKQYDRARALLAEARYELLQSNFPLADVSLLQARTAYLAGDAQAASIFIHQIQTNPTLKPSDEYMVQAIMLEGEMACDRNDWNSAADLLNKAEGYLKLNVDSLLQAQLASLTGRVALGRRDFKAAVNAFERQAELLSRSGQYRALSSVLARAGEVHSVLDEHDLAADRLFRAARIAAAWGDKPSAMELCKKALNAANKADDSTIARLAESLLSEIFNDR